MEYLLMISLNIGGKHAHIATIVGQKKRACVFWFPCKVGCYTTYGLYNPFKSPYTWVSLQSHPPKKIQKLLVCAPCPSIYNSGFSGGPPKTRDIWGIGWMLASIGGKFNHRKHGWKPCSLEPFTNVAPKKGKTIYRFTYLVVFLCRESQIVSWKHFFDEFLEIFPLFSKSAGKSAGAGRFFFWKKERPKRLPTFFFSGDIR